MMPRLTTAVALCFALQAFAIDRADISAAYDNLDVSLSERTRYIDGRQAYIDSLCSQLRHTSAPDADLLMSVADAYTGFNNDSALAYLSHGIAQLPARQALPFRWKQASLLPLGGFFDRAINLYQSIDSASVPEPLRASYYDAGRQMHSYIAAFFRSTPSVATLHDSLALAAQRRLLDALPAGSEEYNYNLAEYNFLIGNTTGARLMLEQLIDCDTCSLKFRARAAHHLSQLSLGEGDSIAYTYYLTLSADADVRAATREMASLQELGTDVYASGDVRRAHRYLSAALTNAVECGAPWRMVESSRSLPIIERAHSDYLAANRRTLYIIMGIMALLMVALVIVAFVLRHEMHRMTLLQTKLRDANTTKEVYISRFLQLCSIYMDKLNQFSKIATRKLAAGQADDLYRMMKSGRFVEEQSTEFYQVFDNAFLHIYPDFPAHVNRLLRPDARIQLRHGELLNTDLRILAFLRLGIEESSRIAQVLNYSLNTIYSYRNRLKGRAINRDTFERDIMNIDSVGD